MAIVKCLSIKPFPISVKNVGIDIRVLMVVDMRILKPVVMKKTNILVLIQKR